jgi:RimJ/RimL family protein N-acetyltransferase
MDVAASAVPPPPLPEVDGWLVRRADPDGADPDLLCRWMRSPHVAEYWRQAWPRARWERELRDQLGGAHSLPCVVERDDGPVLYLEVYRAARDRVASCYPAAPHDLGLHVAIGDPARTGRGLVRALLPPLTDALFAADPECTRVILEPDVRNERAIRSFTAGGFTPAGEISLPDKTALLMVRAR